MYIYLLEYYEEIEHADFTTDKYNLIGIYSSESEVQAAKESIVLEKKIADQFLYISSTKIGRLQWEGGFVSV